MSQYTPHYSYVQVNDTSIPLEGLIIRCEEGWGDIAYRFKRIRLNRFLYRVFKFRKIAYTENMIRRKKTYLIKFHSKLIREGMDKPYLVLEFDRKAEQVYFFNDLMGKLKSTGLVCASVQKRI